MAFNFARFRTDEAAENEGVWFEVGEGFEIKVARLGNRKHAETYARLTSTPAVRGVVADKKLTDEQAIRIMVEAMADAILIDWKNLEEDGNPIPFSREKALELLDVKDFRALVHDFASQQSNFRVKQIAEATEALKKS